MRIRVGELYEKESKKRIYLARKHRFYRFFGYNPERRAFRNICAFCFTDLTDESVVGVWERSAFWDFNVMIYEEEHKCAGCNQRWRYLRGETRGRYKFDARIEAEMKSLEWLREKNRRRIERMSQNRKSENVDGEKSE